MVSLQHTNTTNTTVHSQPQHSRPPPRGCPQLDHHSYGKITRLRISKKIEYIVQ